MGRTECREGREEKSGSGCRHHPGMAGKRAAAAQAQSTLDNLLQHVAEASATMEAVTFSADECPGEW